MPDKKSIILESVRKLIALDLSDEEIIRNLRDVGINERDARSILNEVKGIRPGKPGKAKKPGKPEKPLPKPEPSGLGALPGAIPETEEDLMRELSRGLDEEEFKEKKEEKQEKKVWEKAVMDTANTKLDEMKNLKKDLDVVIEARVKKGLEGEYKKISALISSKSALMSEKINSDMEVKHAEIDQLLDQRVKEIVRINEEMKKTFSGLAEWNKKYSKMRAELTEIEKNIEGIRAGGLSQIQIQKKQSIDEMTAQSKQNIGEMMDLIKRANNDLKAFIGKTRKDVQAQKSSMDREILTERQKITKSLQAEREKRISELENELEEKRDKTIERLDDILSEKLSSTEKGFSDLKTKLFSEVESSLQESRGDISEFTAKAQAEIKRLDSRVTKTLELESEVIEDVMNEAKEKIERVKLESQRDLEAKINAQIREFQQLQAKIDPVRVKKRIDELEKTRDKIRAEISRRITEKLQGIDKEYQARIRSKLVEIEKKTGETAKRLDQIIKSADAKAKELEQMHVKVDAKVEERLGAIEKEYSVKVKPRIAEIERIHHEYEKGKIELGSLKTDTAKAREQLIAQVNSDMIKTKTELKTSVARYEASMSALSKQATSIINSRAALIRGLEPYARMDLEKIRKQVALKALKDTELNLAQTVQQHVREIGKAKEKAKAEAMQSVGFDQIQSQIKQLNLFKKQFLKAIDGNIEQFNQRILAFNNASKKMEEQFNARVKIIDRKMNELSNFEKNFSKAIGTSLSKMEKSKPAKK